MYGLNLNRLSLKLEEECDSDISDCSETECDTAESSTERYGEISQDVLQIEDQLESVQEAQEAVGCLEDITSKSEEVMNDPNATEEQIQNQIEVSQEAFAFAMGKIGYSYKDLKNIKVNTESVSNKREKLKLHTESIGTFIKNAGNNIIKFIKKIWEFFKNLFLKFISWVKGLFIKEPPKKENPEFEKAIKEEREESETNNIQISSLPMAKKEPSSNIKEPSSSLPDDNLKNDYIATYKDFAKTYVHTYLEGIGNLADFIATRFGVILHSQRVGETYNIFNIFSNLRDIYANMTKQASETNGVSTSINAIFYRLLLDYGEDIRVITNNSDKTNSGVTPYLEKTLTGTRNPMTITHNCFYFKNRNDELLLSPKENLGQINTDWNIIDISLGTSDEGYHIGLVIVKNLNIPFGVEFKEVQFEYTGKNLRNELFQKIIADNADLSFVKNTVKNRKLRYPNSEELAFLDYLKYQLESMNKLVYNDSVLDNIKKTIYNEIENDNFKRKTLKDSGELSTHVNNFLSVFFTYITKKYTLEFVKLGGKLNQICSKMNNDLVTLWERVEVISEVDGAYGSKIKQYGIK